MKNFFIILGAVFLILLLVVIFGGKKTRRRIFGFFVEEIEETPFRPDPTEKKGRQKAPRTGGKNTTRRNANQAITEMAILQQKIDERRRVVDSTGHSKIFDEYFELVFQTRKGETIRLVTSRATFKEVPFNQEGALTYKKGVLLKFKYYGGLITDEYSPLQDDPQ